MILAALIAAEALRIAVPAPIGAAQAIQDAAGAAEILSDALKQPVAGIVESENIVASISSGKVDFAWLSAADYVAAAKKAPIVPIAKLVRGGMPFYRSVIFVKKEGGAKQLNELKGKRLAFVSKTSSAGYVVPRDLLKKAGFTDADLAKAEFFGDHAAVCKAVLTGEADAGATFSNDGRGGPLAGCTETAGAEKTALLKPLASSDPIPNDVIVVKATASADLAAAVKKALLTIPADKMQSVFHADAFVSADDGDFAPLRDVAR